MEDHNSTSKDEFLGIIIASHHRQEFLAHTWSQIQAAAPLLVGQLVLIGQAQFYNDATRLYTSSKTHNVLYYLRWLKRAAAANRLVYLHHQGSPKSAAAQLLYKKLNDFLPNHIPKCSINSLGPLADISVMRLSAS